jgi:hypothetical protein
MGAGWTHGGLPGGTDSPGNLSTFADCRTLALDDSRRQERGIGDPWIAVGAASALRARLRTVVRSIELGRAAN